jgi:RNA ligase
MKFEIGIDADAVRYAIANGYITVQQHPNADLQIFNYTQKAQFDWYWTLESKVCRGLIVTNEGRTISRPFPKFFGYEQLNGEVPKEPFEVYEKLDGSLGILYWIDDEPFIATRGSFISEQAQKATEILRQKYNHVILNRHQTYLFEIIYPQNRIVVDYGNTEDLFLLAIIDNQTGEDLELQNIGFPLVNKYDGIKDISEILSKQDTNREGFVIKFKSGFRVKVKFAEYKRLHKLFTGINSRHVWEAMSNGTSLEYFLDCVPDEYFGWVKQIEADLLAAYQELEDKVLANYKIFPTRKETAAYFQALPHSGILFAKLDSRDYSQQIWRLIKPPGEVPYQTRQTSNCD